ncbi:LysR family transcriptional regulator [Nonomuraea sp. CA-141351]|uniref:LysR family transcriptional regulator n=1 Tax=Nonomuraea sp. CA-141351 TaxID=3239996 RepID=UPI003D93D566
MNAELKHLRYFVAVAEELNFSAAARRLYVSQQALSRVIQQLERELGVRLFDRTTRSVRLTRAGEALLESAGRSITAVQHAFDAARQAAQDGQGRPLRVDISSSGLETGARILRRLRREHPRIRVHQVEDGVPRGLAALRDGRLDMLLGLSTHCPPEVRAEVIRREPVLVGMAAGHPLARLDAVPVAMLADVELLLPSDEAAIEWVEFVRSFCRQAQVKPSRWPGATHGSAANAEVLRETGCVVPTATWADPPGDLVFRPLVEPTPILEWSMMTARSTTPRPETETLLTCARATFQLTG